jgi:hypothetical protein
MSLRKYFPIGFRFSWRNAINLFLIVGLPIHFWALLIWFRDIDTLIERTNLFDAIGVGGYTLVYALLESLLIFFVFLGIGFLIPRKVDEEKALLTSSLIYLILVGWVILEQVRYLDFFSEENLLISALRDIDTIFSPLGALIFSLFLASLILPAIMLHRSIKFYAIFKSLIERFTILAMVLIFLDFVGVFTVIFRNL